VDGGRGLQQQVLELDVSMRSVFQTSERSVMRTSAKRRTSPHPFDTLREASAAAKYRGVQLHGLLISTRIAAVVRAPLALRRRSSRAMAGCPAPRQGRWRLPV